MASRAKHPTDVHPEYDHPIPENIEEWSEDQLAEYNSLKERGFKEKQRENRRDEHAERKAQLDAIKSAVQDTDEPKTAEVTVGEAVIEVRTGMTGRLEDRIDTLAQGGNSLGTVKETCIEAILEVIVDGDAYHSRAVWEEFHEEYGSEGLIEVFDELMEPIEERQERVRKFRGNQ